MPNRELLRKLDRTLERNTDAFERNRDAFERNSEAFERNSEAFERNAKAFERNSEAFERNAKAFERHDEVLDALLERHAGITEELIGAINSGFARLQAEIADQRSQIQANTQALLKVLDRLEPKRG